MAIVAAVDVLQSALSPNLVTLDDVSTGTDVTITTRRIYITNSQGNYLVEAGNSNQYTDWPNFPTDTEITLDILTQDTAVHLLVQYLTSGGAIVTTYENDYPLSEFGKQFFCTTFQQIAANPGILQDTNYLNNLCIFWINLTGGNNLVTEINDLAGAQNCFNRETFMQNNENDFF